MVLDTKELYNVLNTYGNGNPYALIGHVFEFNSILNILEKQLENSNDLNRVIENYKFINQYARNDGLVEVRNNIANKIMQKYGIWGLDKKEIVKAFLDSSELKNLEDLENTEIRKYSDNTGYVIFNKNKTFIRLVSLNYNEKIYDIPKALMPVVVFFINRGLKKIPVWNKNKIRMEMLSINVNPEENYFGRSNSDQTEEHVL